MQISLKTGLICAVLSSNFCDRHGHYRLVLVSEGTRETETRSIPLQAFLVLWAMYLQGLSLPFLFAPTETFIDALTERWRGQGIPYARNACYVEGSAESVIEG